MFVELLIVIDSWQTCFFAGFAFACSDMKGCNTGMSGVQLSIPVHNRCDRPPTCGSLLHEINSASSSHLPDRNNSVALALKLHISEGTRRPALRVAPTRRAAIALERHVSPGLNVEAAAEDAAASSERRMLSGLLADRVDEPRALADHRHVAKNDVARLHADLGARLRANVQRHPPAHGGRGRRPCEAAKHPAGAPCSASNAPGLDRPVVAGIAGVLEDGLDDVEGGGRLGVNLGNPVCGGVGESHSCGQQQGGGHMARVRYLQGHTSRPAPMFCRPVKR